MSKDLPPLSDTIGDKKPKTPPASPAPAAPPPLSRFTAIPVVNSLDDLPELADTLHRQTAEPPAPPDFDLARWRRTHSDAGLMRVRNPLVIEVWFDASIMYEFHQSGIGTIMETKRGKVWLPPPSAQQVARFRIPPQSEALIPRELLSAIWSIVDHECIGGMCPMLEPCDFRPPRLHPGILAGFSDKYPDKDPRFCIPEQEAFNG